MATSAPQGTYDTFMVRVWTVSFHGTAQSLMQPHEVLKRERSPSCWLYTHVFLSRCVFTDFDSRIMALQDKPSKSGHEDARLLHDAVSNNLAEGTVVGPVWVLNSQAMQISQTKKQLKMQRQLKTVERRCRYNSYGSYNSYNSPGAIGGHAVGSLVGGFIGAAIRSAWWLDIKWNSMANTCKFDASIAYIHDAIGWLLPMIIGTHQCSCISCRCSKLL